MFIIMVYVVIVFFTSIPVFDTFFSSLGWSGLLNPLVAVCLGSTLRSVFYGNKRDIFPTLIFALIGLTAVIIWIEYTGYHIKVFEFNISGWVWVVTGFIVGFLFTPRGLALRNIGADAIATTEEVISDFGFCMMKHKDSSIAFYDEKLLPHPKEKIASCLITAAKLGDKKLKENLTISLISLAHFQKDVGDNPIYISAVSGALADRPMPEDGDEEGMAALAAEYLSETEKNSEKLRELQSYFERDMKIFGLLIDQG